MLIAIMLNVSSNPFMLSLVMLRVVMPSVMAPCSWSLSCPTLHVNYVSGWDFALILFLSQMFVLWPVL
jgi:hypothetical protein